MREGVGSFVDAMAPGMNVVHYQDSSWLGTGTSFSTSWVTGWAAGFMASAGHSSSGTQVETLSGPLQLHDDPREGALRLWQESMGKAHLALSIGAGPAPYPSMVSDFQSLLPSSFSVRQSF